MLLLFVILFHCNIFPADDGPSSTVLLSDSSAQVTVSIPLGGNSWLTTSAPYGTEEITDDGWKGWKNTGAVFSTFVKLRSPGTLNVAAIIRVPKGNSTIQCSIKSVSISTAVSGSRGKEYFLGSWEIDDSGYVRIDMNGISRTGPSFAEIREVRISGTAVDSNAAFVKNNEGNYFYWGRRGPSVHINYDADEVGNDAEWFYSEITVPDGNDVIGSYFMADGFKEGYFGIQVNSETERRVLFSVWSPFQTDDPKLIPEEKKIVLMKKGSDVHTGEFGNEGSGGQSFLVYPWKSNTTYRFLLHALPSGNDHTVFTAYFFAPEQNRWKLMASFSRPATNSYLKHLHSFLENFEPNTGWITRKAFYGNQWVRNAKGEWKPISKMMFSGDATAQKGYRLDYRGGVDGTKFFLQDCGFFDQQTRLRSSFKRLVNDPPPSIDFSTLE